MCPGSTLSTVACTLSATYLIRGAELYVTGTGVVSHVCSLCHPSSRRCLVRDLGRPPLAGGNTCLCWSSFLVLIIYCDMQSSMQMTDTQKANMMEARVAYIKKIGELLMERQELRTQLQVFFPPPFSPGPTRQYLRQTAGWCLV